MYYLNSWIGLVRVGGGGGGGGGGGHGRLTGEAYPQEKHRFSTLSIFQDALPPLENVS
jgi:hypothetical protein